MRLKRTWRFPALPVRRDDGMSTAEYAIGVLSACSFAGLLLKILTSDQMKGLLGKLIERALSMVF